MKNEWRPTRLRYGEVLWQGQTARLNLRVGDERPFVPRFLTAHLPKGRRTRLFPCDQRELCLATAWRLVEDGHAALIFCPERRSVEPYADAIVDLHERGSLKSLLQVDKSKLRPALVLGREWLGEDHPILRCLELGVAIHHGALPTAFRKEVERLLREGVFKVTISSPTLAQGLNLAATTVIMHSLHRHGTRVEVPEFKNVIGRAGRAYIDVEGLVLFPVFDNHQSRIAQWEGLIADLSTREMESGLVRLVTTLLQRMQKRVRAQTADALVEYIMNNADAWSFPEVVSESAEEREGAKRAWEGYLASLDTAVLSLLGDVDVPDEQIPAALDAILSSSLWERGLTRKTEGVAAVLKAGLVGRARYIWARSTTTTRRGYFLAGVGLSTGHALDALAEEANQLLVSANGALLANEPDAAIKAISRLAELAFATQPFGPDNIPPNWRDLLRCWLLGQPLAKVAAGQEAETLQFVEQALVYRLPWAMDAIRVRALANGDTIGGLTLDNFELGLAVSAVETGTMRRPASLLIQAGFTSRLAAIKAIEDTGATFSNGYELREWLASDTVRERTRSAEWPTDETAEMWATFAGGFAPQAARTWSEKSAWSSVKWHDALAQSPGTPIRVHHIGRRTAALTSDGADVGTVLGPVNPQRQGLLRIAVGQSSNVVEFTYLGPDDLWLTQ